MKLATALFAAVLALPLAAQDAPARPLKVAPGLLKLTPAPQLKYLAQETYPAGGKNWVRYTYEITNRAAYPTAFWTPAPTLPPCGSNANASRAWVDIFSASGTKLYGYCAATSANEFKVFGFQLEAGTPAPYQIYVVITDRQTGQSWKSNLAGTGAPPPPTIG